MQQIHMKFGLAPGKLIRMLAAGIILLGALPALAQDTGENIVKTVAPNSAFNVTFTKQNTSPIWSLTVYPEVGYNHKPDTVKVNSLRWETTARGGANGEPARFRCATSCNPVERQFRNRIFSGELAPIAGVRIPGQGGSSVKSPAKPSAPTPVHHPPPPVWTVTGKTDENYLVLPEAITICLGGSATFWATNDGARVLVPSSWTSAPYIGANLPNGASVPVPPTNPGAPVAAHGINLVDEDNTGGIALGLVKEVPDP